MSRKENDLLSFYRLLIEEDSQFSLIKELFNQGSFEEKLDALVLEHQENDNDHI